MFALGQRNAAILQIAVLAEDDGDMCDDADSLTLGLRFNALDQVS